jgi:hypothetical protein
MFHRIIELAPMDLNVRARLIDQLVLVGKIEHGQSMKASNWPKSTIAWPT